MTRAASSATAAAHGAVSVLNATATGVGCSLAVSGGVEATWQWGGAGLRFQGATDDRLAQAIWRLLSEDGHEGPDVPDGTRGLAEARRASVDEAATTPRGTRAEPSLGATTSTRAAFPPARGLKTSSSAAGALVSAALHARGQDPGWAAIANLAVRASLRAGVTITGAYDDQVAVLRGGAHLTDNRARRTLRSLDVHPWHVAVWVPDASIPKAAVAALDPSPAVPAAHAIAEGLRTGAATIPEAMTENGRLYTRLYAAAGLPVDERATESALAAGALGAGLSGTGPAVAALFDAPAQLEPVPGGTWQWTRAVEASA